MQTKKFNHNYEDGIPLGVGDRYYAQDLSRDNRYLQTLALRGLSAIYDTDSGILNGLQLTKKSESLLGLTAGIGYCHYAVTIVDDDQPWVVPPQTKTEDILGLVSIETQDIQITPEMKNGNKHYVKAIYKEKILQSRARQVSDGSYGYVVVDDYKIKIDEIEPTKYEVLLGTFQGTDEITVTGEKPEPSKIPDNIQQDLDTHIAKTTGVHGATSAPTANKIAIRDSAGRMQVVSPATAADVANKSYVDAKTWDAASDITGVLPINHGGTGASEVLKALQNLGVYCRLRNAGDMTSKELLLKLSADHVPQVGQAIVISSTYYIMEGSNITFPDPIGVVNTANSMILLVIHQPFSPDATWAACEGIIFNGKENKVYSYCATQSNKTTIEETGALLTQSLSDLGVTATATELNYVGGVTSNIQSQLNGKAKNPGNPGTPTEIEDSAIAFPITPGWYLVELWGGGGGGGAGSTGISACGGGGGGGGSYTAVFLYINVSSINVTIGKGGRSNMRSDGDPGGTTSVTIAGIKYTATGGAGGGAGTTSARGIGGYGNTFGGTGGESESMGHDGTNAYRNGGGGGQSSGGGGGGGGGGGYENGGEGGEGSRDSGGTGFPGMHGAGGGGGGGTTNGEPGIGGKGGDGIVILTPFNA